MRGGVGWQHELHIVQFYVRVCATIIDQHEDMALLHLHLIIHRLEPLGEEDGRHPCLFVVSVCDTKALDWVALERPRLCALADNEQRQLLSSRTSGHQGDDAILCQLATLAGIALDHQRSVGQGPEEDTCLVNVEHVLWFVASTDVDDTHRPAADDILVDIG